MVSTGFKGKVESRVYSTEERLELCTRDDMWREIGLLTGHRKSFASALLDLHQHTGCSNMQGYPGQDSWEREVKVAGARASVEEFWLALGLMLMISTLVF